MPYNPGITYNTGVIGQGIANLGQNLAGAIQQYRREKQEGQFLDSQFESLARVVGAADPDRAEDLAKFSGLSLGQKRGKLAGLAFEVNQMQQQQAAKARDRQLQVAEGQFRLSEELARTAAADRRTDRAERSAEREAGRQFSGRLAELVQGGPLAEGFREPGSLSLADVVQAAGESGHQLPPGTLMDAIRTTQRREASAPREFSVGGKRGTYSPETGAFQLLPSDELTPGQKAQTVAGLRAQYAQVATRLADPAMAGPDKANLVAILDMLDEQLTDFGVKPPKRNRTNAGEASGNASTTRFVSDKDGNVRDRR